MSQKSVRFLSFCLLLLASAVGHSQAAPPAAAPGVDADRYVIGPGDTLQVFVWLNPEL